MESIASFVLISMTIVAVFIISIGIAYDKGQYSMKFKEKPYYMIPIPLNEEPDEKFWIQEYNEDLYYVVDSDKLILPNKRKRDYILNGFNNYTSHDEIRIGFECFRK